MDDLESLMAAQIPTAERPLAGLTVLVVEDSRFACEAMRLLCLRSGARIRRADCLASARRHLQVYRPSVVIIDLGLPDGSGEDLIREMNIASPRVGVLLGTSGDPGGRELALAAGADDFLEKPITGLAAFQELILSALPENRMPDGPRPISEHHVHPDPIAFRDDLAHIATVLKDQPDEETLNYVSQFLGGLARSAADKDLETAARTLARHRRAGQAFGPDLNRLNGLVQDRIAATGTI
ncbi:response regulator [Thalassobius sp. I31.1]|uniref:response regulator n=1 Tax=Thalassobius sp. I31.1 TaxID=2109912 RepID=UPI000D1AD072|nr:response regulator [Thalassobius sp. I31.1]